MSRGSVRVNNLSEKQKGSRFLSPNTNLSFDSESPISQVLNLQRIIGNQAVQGLLESGTIQPKLKIGQPGDEYELEADRIAEEVMRMPDSEYPSCVEGEQITPLVQRQVEDTEKKKREEEELVQPKLLSNQTTSILQRQSDEEERKKEEEEWAQPKGENSYTVETSSDVESGINSLKGDGQLLPESVRSYFEPRFGYDFSRVRIHTVGEATETAKSINARAFTIGNDVVFGSSNYSPETEEGKNLIAHELTHVVQQKGKNDIIRRDEKKGEKKPEDKPKASEKKELSGKPGW